MEEKIENYRLLQSFRAGAEKVILQKEELNKINVFPVADGEEYKKTYPAVEIN